MTGQAVVVAFAVKETGEREVIGIEAGPSEDAAFWTEFLRSLVRPGLARGTAGHQRCSCGPA